MRTLIGVMVVIVLGLGALLLWRRLQADEPAAAPLPPSAPLPVEEPFWGKIVNWKVLSRSLLEVKVRLLNTGDNEDEGECDLIAYDRVGAVVSAPVATEGTATPGYRVFVTTRMRVPDKRAEDIERVEVSC